MKLQQLEYVIAIAQEGSITAAAKKLYQAQPNISIALKELESEIGMQIFWRTPNGMVLTPEGEDFLLRANEIVESMHSLEADYSNRADDTVSLRIESTISSYVAAVIGIWVNSFADTDKISIHLTETVTNKIIEDVSGGRADIGVIRIPSSPFEELKNYVQILHGDDELSTFGRNCVNSEYEEGMQNRLLYVYDRGSKMTLMNTIKNAFMWVSPMPNQAFPEGGVVAKKCSYANIRMRDLVVCKKSNENNRLIKEFVDFLAGFVEKSIGTEEE